MKSGYWNDLQKERDFAIDEARQNGGNVESVDEYFRNVFIRRVNAYNNNVCSQEEEFYKKVCILIESGEVINPVTHLIDHDEYDKLDFSARQRYIINLMQKFATMKERYIRENENRKAR